MSNEGDIELDVLHGELLAGRRMALAVAAVRRERIAVQLLAGLLVDPYFSHGSDYTGGIEIALRLTDALIAKLDEAAAANEPLGDKLE